MPNVGIFIFERAILQYGMSRLVNNGLLYAYAVAIHRSGNTLLL